MQLTEQQITELTELAKLFYQPHDIEIIMELPYHSLVEELDNPNSQAYKAYHSGYLTSDYELRKLLMQSATNGSHPAQMEMMKFSNKLKQKLDE